MVKFYHNQRGSYYEEKNNILNNSTADDGDSNS